MAETRIDIVRRCVAEERPLHVGVEWVRELAEEIDALTPPRPEPVAWALCDDEGVFDAEQDEATAKEWVRGGADCGLVRWLRPLVFGDVPEVRFGNPHPSAAAGAEVVECDETAWYCMVDKNGHAHMEHASVSVSEVASDAAHLDREFPAFAPHRVMRVCLMEVDA